MRSLALILAALWSMPALADTYSLTDAQGNVNCVLWDGKRPYAPPAGTTLSARPSPSCAPVSVAARPSQITRSAFLGRFTPAELTALSAAARTNDAINVWLITAQAADQIDLSSARIKAGLDALVTAGILTAARQAEILAP